MRRIVRISVLIQMLTFLHVAPAHAGLDLCRRILGTPKSIAPVEWLRLKIVDNSLNILAATKGLPKYLELVEELKQSGRYKDEYENFGAMGLREMGISVRYNREKLEALNTGRPLIIVANHHLGIADGLAMQYLSSHARTNAPSVLLLARWIEKLLPMAVFDKDKEKSWGTAIPVEINMPKKSDPDYEAKFKEANAYNSRASKTALAVLKMNGTDIIFPQGYVAPIRDGSRYPHGVQDEQDSWQDGFLKLAKLGKADIVFAHVDSVNSEDFYKKRKRFGGGDKERVIWFFSEALAKKDQAIDVYLSKPMSLADAYATLADRYGYPRETVKGEPLLMAELMRRYTYQVSDLYPQVLDVNELPQKKNVP